MSNSSPNIHFDYCGHYTSSSGEDVWNRDGHMYGIPFKTSLENIRYSALVDKICRKIGVEHSKVKLSYIPLNTKPSKETCIQDDDDVYVYLTTLDKERRRGFLHVERKLDLEINEQAAVDNVNVGEMTLYQAPIQENEGIVDGIGDGVNEGTVGGENEANDEVVATEFVEVARVEEENMLNESWEDGMSLEIGQEFSSKKELKEEVERASHHNYFGVVTVKSDTKRYVVKCVQAKKGCDWYLRGAKIGDSECFSVRVYRKTHTCNRARESGYINRGKCTPQMVASIIKEDYAGLFDTPSPQQLIELVKSKLGATVSYSTAWRGKNLAASELRGDPEESYKSLFCHLHMLKQVNLGTKTSVELDEGGRFKYLFVALGASIEGFKSMRKVLIVDATFLKTMHGGVLLFATAQDPNRHHYLIAFGIVDGEKDASWTWFFRMLKTVVPDCTELVFVTDRNASLINAIAGVYPMSQHGYCIFHISQNVRTRVKSWANKNVVAKKFRECAQIYTEAEFEKEYGEFENRYKSVAEYLHGSVDKKKWARCYFPGARYNIDTTNCVESMNAIFKDARKYSLLPMIDCIIGKISEWFNKHRKECVAGPDARKLVPVVEKELHKRVKVATHLTVKDLNTFLLEYNVTGRDGKSYYVELRNKSCSCRCFDIDKYPCVHAIAANIRHMNQEDRRVDISLPDLCSQYYWIESWRTAYSKTIYAVPHKSAWVIPDDILELTILPPKRSKKRGRIQQTRFPSVGERRRRSKYARASNLGRWFKRRNTSNTSTNP